MTKIYLAFALAFLSPLASADQRILVDSLLPADFEPAAVTAWTPGGFWSLGTSNTIPSLVHYNAIGSADFMRFPVMPDAFPPFQLVAHPDGGAVSTDLEDTTQLGYQACKMRRYDAAGNQLWTSDLAGPTGVIGSGTCSDVYIDGGGGVWLFRAGINETYMISVNDDGTSGMQMPLYDNDNFPQKAVADPAQAGIFMAGCTGRPDVDPATTLATIWRVTTQGIQWAASAPAADAGSVLESVVVAGDGSQWGFGSKGVQLYGMHVDTSGNVVWSGAFDTTVLPREIVLAPLGNGGVSSMHWDSSTFYTNPPGPELSTFSSTGTRVWHQSAGFAMPQNASIGQFSLVAASNGDLSAAMSYYDTASRLQQRRIDSSGAPLFATAPQSVPTSTHQLEMLPDGTSLTVAGSFQHLSRNGSALTAPDTTAITTSASFDENAVFANDGAAYVVVTNQREKTVGVAAYSNSGALRWHTTVPAGTSETTLSSVTMLLRQSDVCLAGDLYGNELVQCLALVDGTPSTPVVLASGLSQVGTLTQATVTSDNRIVMLYQRADAHVMHHVLLDTNGTLVHDITPLQAGEVLETSAQNAQGQTLVLTGASSLLELDADGSRLYAVPCDLAVQSLFLGPDGRGILSTRSSPLVIEGIDAAGTRMWQTTMPTGTWNFVRSVRFVGDDMYMPLISSGLVFNGSGGQVDGLLAKLSLSSGAIEWSSPLPYRLGFSPRVVLDPYHNQAITFTVWGDRTQLRRYSMSDGTPLGNKFETCGVDQCVLYQAILATDGTLRMVHDTTDYFSGSAFELTTLQNVSDTIFADAFGFSP